MKTFLSPARLLMILATSLLIIVFSCKKESSETNDAQQENASRAATEADATAEIIFNDVFDNVIGVNNEVGLEGTGVFGRMASPANNGERVMGCYTVNVAQVVQGQLFPLRITIDFGSGCTGKDGRTRSGKIITEYSGRLTVPGKSSTTHFENYKVDSLSVEGTYNVSNSGNVSLRQFTVDVTGAKLSWKTSNYIGWNSHRIVTQTQGLGTPDFFADDVFGLTGNSSGEVTTALLATAWQSTIKETLQKKFTCRWINQGIVEVTRQNLSSGSKWTGSLDYGTGECDNKAVLTVNGIAHQITLH